MIIAIIHWRIKPTDVHVQAFLSKWAHELLPPREILVGEFLSVPLSPDEVGFPNSDLGLGSREEYRSFINVGMWESTEAFRREVYEPFGKRTELYDFEVDFPERLILGPLMWRVGVHPMPKADKLSIDSLTSGDHGGWNGA